MPTSFEAPESNRTEPESLTIGPIEIRPREYQVFVQGQRLHFTVREFQTFWMLAKSPDRVIPRGVIYAEVWGMHMPYRDRAVDTFVRKVRLKLAAVAPDWTFIHTHFGIGYRFSPERMPADGPTFS
jgi:DNA-binding response OmpR family regulator